MALDIDRLKQGQRWRAAAEAQAERVAGDLDQPAQWVQLGHALKESGALDAAAFAYRNALEADETEWDAMLHLGHLLRSRGRLEEALALFEALARLPFTPAIDHEIDELTVFLHPKNRQAALSSFPQDAPQAPEATAIVARLSGLLAAHRAAQGRGHRAPRGWALVRSQADRLVRLMLGRSFKAELVAKRDLIIRDGRYVAQTDHPQFAVRLPRGLPMGWVEILFEARAETARLTPVLFLARRPPFRDVRIVPLEQAGVAGRFRAMFHLDGPPAALRLDPLHRRDSFTVTQFTLRPVKAAAAPGEGEGAAAAGGTPALPASSTLALKRGDSLYAAWFAEQMRLLAADDSAGATGGSRAQPAVAVLIDGAAGPTGPAAASRLSLPAQPSGAIRVDGSPAEVLAGLVESFTLVLRPGGRLVPDAVFRFRAAARRHPDALLFYCDEDFSEGDTVFSPLFKPDWDIDLHLAADYVGPCVMVATAMLKRLADDHPEAALFELVQRLLLSAPPERIVHIDEVLHHRPGIAGKRPDLRQIVDRSPAERALIERLLGERDIGLATDRDGLAHVVYPLPRSLPRVSLIIPTRDHLALLRGCIGSLATGTDYPDLEIVVVDNGSVEPATQAYLRDLSGQPDRKVLPAPGAFNFSRLCNLGVEAASGAFVCLVNNDIVAIRPDWLRAMLRHGLRPDVGAVGAKLLYPSGHVQHAGIAGGIGMVCGHVYKYETADTAGPFGMLQVAHRVGAVTGACLLVDKARYRAVGGLDEQDLQVAFNDVDLCLKLESQGFRTILEPRARLLHLESFSRGRDVTPEKRARYDREGKVMIARWKPWIDRDPWYNRHLSRTLENGAFNPGIGARPPVV
ncbi:hypothetical protein BJF92_07265 [Rhizobium rhizosphaerae]|uniref:Glycosyltransferase n=1 Tax=Xaviernesmea rhizosphaerae TaxID=1672749 RepID=A0A1Q9ACY4_9HYPH|nr:glycosyltransferase [Xaviernesmea rhizosphaerae]OLP52778.1 hypothetical protein BJF92_07265 [Xaviernesmea rhizosphaerae]